MLGVLIFCWGYLILTLLGRIVNYDKISKEAIDVRVIDNIVIFGMTVLLIYLYSQS